MNNFKNSILKNITYAILVSAMAFSAWAISLDDAKQQGLVGEMPNGYLGVVVNSAEAQSLVESINKKRKSIYIDLARENKLTMQQVTALAGAKAIEKTQSGHFIKNAAGNWVKK
ncbi:YdbL family protein [Thalassotalea piscium]|uniref:DUF1318 domain-containing protein n=1 Tax=Thalassotalea piscium TaxID=1230533 RepID=A0A7X0NGX2_9GAMM|nr:YdbL family protein [Thalassotalea piscium]MBB6543265.1 hypothetical protein [Thalassotalea piscium]